jgi:hypothetical protein
VDVTETFSERALNSRRISLVETGGSATFGFVPMFGEAFIASVAEFVATPGVSG